MHKSLTYLYLVCFPTMKSLHRIYHPEIFQGSLSRENYFEGWYFKHVSADSSEAIAVITGVSLSDDPHAFIQFIDGTTAKTSYYRYPLNEFIFSSRKLEVTAGKSFFSENKISLDLENADFRITGNMTYRDSVRFPKKIMRPGIMGWYSFVPNMECNHGVVSASHSLEGRIEVNGLVSDFNGGKGYIEKDWGTSFPESWIWMQCNNFERKDISVMISVAKIPWMGSWFMGFISFISIAGRIIILATYNGAKISSIRKLDETHTQVVIRKGSLTLKAVTEKKGAGTLRAPVNGLMESVIKESLNSEVMVELKEGKETLFSGRGIRAGYEETEKIFTYFT